MGRSGREGQPVRLHNKGGRVERQGKRGRVGVSAGRLSRRRLVAEVKERYSVVLSHGNKEVVHYGISTGS